MLMILFNFRLIFKNSNNIIFKPSTVMVENQANIFFSFRGLKNK